jgi:hypothetical protein
MNLPIQELKYNLYLVEFTEIENIVLSDLKNELLKFGFLTYEDLPRKDYLKLLQYFTLHNLCKAHRALPHKKNTIFYLNKKQCNQDIVKFIEEARKYFPIPVYVTTDSYFKNDPGVYSEISLKVKEYRYSIDFSKFSFSRIKKFCKTYELDNFITDFKL